VLSLCRNLKQTGKMAGVSNNGKTATDTQKNKVAGKAQMPEVQRREVTNR
jgi:hypothetical protein